MVMLVWGRVICVKVVDRSLGRVSGLDRLQNSTKGLDTVLLQGGWGDVNTLSGPKVCDHVGVSGLPSQC